MLAGRTTSIQNSLIVGILDTFARTPSKTDLSADHKLSPYSPHLHSNQSPGDSSPVLYPAASKHYYSHKIAQRAVVAPAPRVIQPTIVETNVLESKLNNFDELVEMPKRNIEGLKRIPLVVIPKRRKHKNFVSRRRNTLILASLRRCSSDPVLYKSYNHWSALSKNNEAPKKEVDQTAAKTTIEPIPKRNSIQVKPSEPKSSRKPTLSEARKKFFELKDSSKDAHENQESKSPDKGKLSIEPRHLNSKKETAPSPSVTRKETAPSSSTRKETALSLSTRKETAPSPSTRKESAPSPSVTRKETIPTNEKPEKPEKQPPAAIERKISTRRKKADELAQIKKDLLESASKLSTKNASTTQKESVVNKKEPVTKKESETTISDETKAKNTVNAVTAAFSSVGLNNKTAATTTTSSNKAQESAPTTSTTAAKPPTTPSSIRREAQRLNKLHESLIAGTSTTVGLKSTRLKDVPPTHIPSTTTATATPTTTATSTTTATPTTTTTSEKQQTDFIVRPPEVQAECTASITIQDDENEGVIETPILTLSKQAVSKQTVEQPKKPANPQTAALLASLQLPPSVTARVDKIISTGGTKKAGVCFLNEFLKVFDIKFVLDQGCFKSFEDFHMKLLTF